MRTTDRDNLDASILQAVVAPEEASLSVPIARAVLALSFQSAQQAEIERLLERNNAGTIKRNDKTRLEAYVRVGNFLSLLKAKAKATLAAKSREP